MKITRRSFVFFISKVVACFAVSGAFLLGMFIEPLYGKPQSPSKHIQIECDTLAHEKWKCEHTSDGHEWILYRNHSEPAQQILTVRFDDQSNIRSINFSSEQ